MRQDYIADTLKARGAVNLRRLHLILWQGLQPCIEDHEGKWRSMPDAVNNQGNPHEARRGLQ